MASRIRHGLLISIVVVGLFLISFVASYAGSINYIYDDLGRLYQVFDPQGNVTTYNYDAAGNLLSITRSTVQKIVSVNPPAGLTNVPTNTLIAVLFTKPVDRTTISGASFSLVESNTATPVQGTFPFDFDDRMVIFAPQSVLKPSTGYTLNIATSIKSADGMPLDHPFSGSFVTGGASDTVSPTVTSVPVDGATGVPMNTNVVFIFSEPMNPASLNSSTIVVTNNGMPVSGNITLNGINTSATFVPLSSFLPDSLVNVTLSSGVTDMAGNHIVGSGGVGTDFISSFTTGNTADNTAPEVLSITPADGAIGIDRNTVVSVAFNEVINPVTVNSETFTISVGGVRQSGRISFSGQNTIVTFTADQPFATLSLVTVTLLPGISDMAGNPVTSTFTSSFTTMGEPRLVIGYPGPTTLTLGDTINVEVANTGDSDTSSTYTVKLSDESEVIIYQNTIFDTIEAGVSKTYGFQIPNQAADSDYTLYAEVIDSRNIKTANSFGIKIIGLNAVLSTRTDKDIYLPTESITAISNILNGQFVIEDGGLKVSVSKTSQSTTGQFTHFLPKKGWWPLNYPEGVAVGPDGSVYVADRDNHRIQKFDGIGNFITKWGSEGSGDGQFEYPVNISVASDGSVYVAERDNHRIQKFDSNGNFITKWGTQCITDPNWDGVPDQPCDGQFYYPYGIAIGLDGSVYVADSGNNRIQKFDSNGNFITKWGSYCVTDPNWDGVPEDPCDGGQFASPYGIATGSDGLLYVVDSGNNRIEKFDSNGNFIEKWGSYCEVDSNWDGVPDQPCNGQFYYAYGIATGPDGSFYVADSGNNRIQKFDGNGNFITKWGSRCMTDTNLDGVPDQPCDGQFDWPEGIALSSDGSIYVADNYNNRIQKFDGSGNFITKWGNEDIGDGQFKYPESISVVSDGSVYVADIYNHRIQKFDGNGNFVTKWGSEGSGDGEFEYPEGITVGPDGSIYVADFGNHRIQKFDSNGNFITKWGSEGSGDGQFEGPVGISVATGGSVYVADRYNSRIQKFDSSGNFITKWGSYCVTDPNGDGVPEQPCDGQFNSPEAISVGPDGSVYVVDMYNQRIQKFYSSGNFITKWGIEGSGDGQFKYPEGITVGPDGSVFVADSGNRRIQNFDSSGNFITKWESTVSGDGEFYYPKGIAVGVDGTVYVVDVEYGRIQRMVPSGIPQTLFETTLPVNQTASSSQDYTTNVGTLSATGKFYLQATLKNSLGQTIGHASYHFYIGDMILSFSPDKKLYTPGETVVISGEVQNRGSADALGLVLSLYSKLNTQNSELVFTETFDLTAGNNHPFTVTTSAGVIGTVMLTGKVSQDDSTLVEIIDRYDVADTSPPTTTASPAGGTYNTPQSVTLTCNDGTGSGCDKIYYTTDGSTPTTSSPVYSSPINISSTTTLKFFATDLAGNSEAVKTEAYTISTNMVTVELKDSTGGPLSGGVVQYYSGGWQTFGTTDASGQVSKELQPENYTFSMSYAFARQETSQNTATNPTVVFQTTKVTIELRDSANSLMDTGTVQYYSGGWRDIGTTSGGQVSKELLPASYTFSITYAFARREKSQNVATNPTVVFQTTKVTVELRDSANSLIDTGTVQYYSGGWRDIGTTSGGQVSKELLPGSYTFSMTYGFARQEKSQNIAADPTVVFQTTNVAVQLKDSTGALMDTGTVQYYSGGWRDIGSTSGGQVSKELLPASYTFSMTYAFARQEKSQNIATNPTVVFQTTRVTVQLKDSTGTLMDTGTVQYYSGGWRDIGSTSGGQVSKELLPLSYTFSMTYGFARQEKSQNIATNPTVIFQTTNVTVQLKDSTGTLIDTGTVQYYSGGWRDIGGTSGGQVTKELLPASYTFSMTYGFARQEKSQNIAADPIVVFQTKMATIQLKDSTGGLIDTGTVQYYSGGWRDIGSTSGGQVSKELLPASYTFSMNYAYARQEKSQNIAADPTVVFQTGQVHSDSGSCTHYYSGGWRLFTQDMELLPVAYTFRFNDGTSDTPYTIITGTVNHIH